MSRLRKTQEVTCKDCQSKYEKRVDTMQNWNGLCRTCSSLHTIQTKIKGIVRVAKKQCVDCGAESKTIGKLERCFPCSIPFKSGKNHYNWKGGITSRSRYERTLFIKVLKQEILKRDDYTCNDCGSRGVNLHIDHIKSWAKHPELRFEPTNCQTLCMACHYQKTFNRLMPKGLVWGNNLS